MSVDNLQFKGFLDRVMLTRVSLSDQRSGGMPQEISPRELEDFDVYRGNVENCLTEMKVPVSHTILVAHQELIDYNFSG